MNSTSELPCFKTLYATILIFSICVSLSAQGVIPDLRFENKYSGKWMNSRPAIPEIRENHFYLPLLSVIPVSVNLYSSAGSKASILITSNTRWHIKCSEEWLSSDIVSGEGVKQVIITATENHDTEGRLAKVTITIAGISPRVIEVYQKAKHEE
jgi:hypothetical protein